MSKSYDIVSIYSSYCGDGYHTGRPATFIRFGGCNGHACPWCDLPNKAIKTLSLETIVNDVDYIGNPFVILTGGEPGLQVDKALVDALHKLGSEVMIETNGTVNVTALCLDWVSVSPKSCDGRGISVDDWKQRVGDELRIAYPDTMNALVMEGSRWFDHKFVSPIREGDLYRYNVDQALDFVRAHPEWRITIDSSKLLYFKGEGHE